MNGTVLQDRYEIEDLLGRGGSGAVYRGKDRRLGRPVAIKVLHYSADTDSVITRFEAEAKNMASLNHPNVVQIYDYGRAESIPYIVMEILQGRTLRQILSTDRLSLRAGLGIMRDVASGLEAIHLRKMIHRDLSSNNIFITESGHTKLIDLGLAKNLDVFSNITPEGSLKGTVAYVSPEQVNGHPATVRSEIFSFGTLLYEVVTGVNPFRADHYMTTLYNITQRDPAPLETYLDAYPAELGKLVTRCLQRDPERRPESIDEVRSVIDTILAAPSPVLAQSTSVTVSAVDRSHTPQNPYHNRTIVRRREDFFGRKQALMTIFARLNGTPPGSMSIVGDRRTGKSSLLYHVYLRQTRQQFLERPDAMLMLYLDPQEQTDATVDSFVHRLLKTSELELRGRVDITDIRHSLEGLKTFVERLHNAGMYLTLILDEFELITNNSNFDLEFFGFLRYLANHYNVAYLTSSLRDLQELTHTKEIATSPFFNIFQTMRLSRFKPEEALELIRVPSMKIGLPLEPYSDQMISLGGLFPFYLQIACSHAIDCLSDGSGGHSLDVAEVEQRFDEDAALHFRHLWSHFDPQEQSVVLNVAGGKNIPSSTKHVFAQLKERGLVEVVKGRAQLFSGSFRRFILRQAGPPKSFLGRLLGRKD